MGKSQGAVTQIVKTLISEASISSFSLRSNLNQCITPDRLGRTELWYNDNRSCQERVNADERRS